MSARALMRAAVRATDLLGAGVAHRKHTRGPLARWVELLRGHPDYYRVLWEQRDRHPPASLRQVNIEPTNLCNLRCTFCANPTQTADTGRMPISTAFEAIDGARAALGPDGVIGFYIRGEPTLHAGLAEMIAHAHRRGMRRTIVSTHAAKLTEALAEKLFAAGLSELRLSIDSPDRARYEGIRVGASFERTCANVAMLDRTRRRMGARVRFRLHAALDGEGLREVPGFVRRWGASVDVFKFTLAVNQGGLFAGEALDAITALRFARSRAYQTPCRLLYQYVGVTWDQKLSPCCVDYTDAFVVGALSGGLPEAFDSEAMRALRAAHERADFGPLCGQCGFASALVDWFEDALNARVERTRDALATARGAARYERWLLAAVARFDALADDDTGAAREPVRRRLKLAGA